MVNFVVTPYWDVLLFSTSGFDSHNLINVLVTRGHLASTFYTYIYVCIAHKIMC